MGTTGVNLLYLVTIVCFVLALRFLSSPATARRGNQIGAVGMVIAIVATLLKASVHITWLMVLGAAIGGAFGAVAARRVKMTAMPQMVALFNGVGGGAAALVALAEFHELAPPPGHIHGDVSLAILLSALIGSDLVLGLAGRVREAAGADQGPADRLPRPEARQRDPDRRLHRSRRDRSSRAASGAGCSGRRSPVALLFGVLFVLPIGGADMPVVISLLNAFTGLAAAATGFELENNVLIVSGMLVGASGTMLTLLMGRAMNRSITNVLFGAFGQVSATGRGAAAVGADGARCARRPPTTSQ